MSVDAVMIGFAAVAFAALVIYALTTEPEGRRQESREPPKDK